MFHLLQSATSTWAKQDLATTKTIERPGSCLHFLEYFSENLQRVSNVLLGDDERRHEPHHVGASGDEEKTTLHRCPDHLTGCDTSFLLQLDAW